MSDGPAIQDTLKSMTGQGTVPNVWINGTHVGGNDDMQAAFRSGELKKVFRRCC